MENRRVIIQRSKWSRATQNQSLYDNALLTDIGTYCCLGFACQQLFDLPDDVLRDVDTPKNLNFDGIIDNVLPLRFCNRAIEINDRSDDEIRYMPDVEQEQTIAALFAEIGITVSYID